MNLLIAYSKFPEPDMDSGSYRLMEIIKILLAGGNAVTVLAATTNEPRYRQALEKLGVRCVYIPWQELPSNRANFARVLTEGRFDAAILGPYNVYLSYAAILRGYLPNCRLALDTVDLHYVRHEREAEMTGNREKAELARRVKEHELRAIADADQIWVVTDPEQEVLGALFPNKPIAVVPNVHDVYQGGLGFADRAGIVFLGGYQHLPNVDAVQFFMDKVVPALDSLLPNVPITLAGSHPPQDVRVYAERLARVMVPGFVVDHRALLAAHRVGIAPLRYGAGMKGKIGEYLACGLPCVTTPIGAEGMHLENGIHALIANEPADFAAAIARLYQDDCLWENISTRGREHLDRHLSGKATAPVVIRAIRELASVEPRLTGQRTAGRILGALVDPYHSVGRIRKVVAAVQMGGLAELARQMRVWVRGL